MVGLSDLLFIYGSRIFHVDGPKHCSTSIFLIKRVLNTYFLSKWEQTLLRKNIPLNMCVAGMVQLQNKYHLNIPSAEMQNNEFRYSCVCRPDRQTTYTYIYLSVFNLLTNAYFILISIL